VSTSRASVFGVVPGAAAGGAGGRGGASVRGAAQLTTVQSASGRMLREIMRHV
jgi:hypothetical protein